VFGMTAHDWLLLATVIVAIFAATPLLGGYMAKVFGSGRAPGDRVFSPMERFLYRVCGIDPDREQRWTVYALSLLAFSIVSILFLLVLQRVQGWLPLNPNDMESVPPALSFNTAVSFVTNTNWQNYSGESTMSHLTQMMGLAVQNFVSAAVGLAVAVALIRGLVRRRSGTIGNFWVDLTRATVRILLPLAFIAALVLVSQGVIQSFSGNTTARTVQGATQLIPRGPVASQEAIKVLGTNGGGFFDANSSHPFESSNGFTNLFEIFLLLVIPFSLTYTFGKLVKDARQGWAVFAAMFALWIAAMGIAVGFETAGNPNLNDVGVTQEVTSSQPGGNFEGKEVRFGPVASGLFAGSTTGTSTGAVNSTHDSFTPAGGGIVLLNIMFGEVSPGGVGAGLYGILVFAILAVFIAGLMVGRTPEYLGKKIQASEMKLVVLYILAVPVVILAFTAASVLLESAKASILNPGEHGLSEITYAFTSAANNNGSAFGGLTGNTDWYNTTLGLSMLIGRFLLIIPVLAIAGSLARKQPAPPTPGTFPTNTPLFSVLLTGVIVLVVSLTFFPVLALGPIAEQLSL
jgi:potassium-transporting ATPase potassium-binding subunit